MALCPLFVALQPAYAETNDIYAEPDSAQLTVEETAAAYDQAVAAINEADQRIAENEGRLGEIETLLPTQQQRSADALCALYMLQQEAGGLINMILDAQSINEFFTTVEYINHIQQRNLSELAQLESLQAELTATQDQLNKDRAAAITRQSDAENALAAAQAAREAAQAQALATAQAQAAAAAAEAEKAKAEQEAQAAAEKETVATVEEEKSPSTQETPAQQPSASEPVEAPSSDNADWASDKATFVSQWGARIDTYLLGSPLYGQGTTFAEAAWNYGVDPRWSPAISNTESSKGLYCFMPHNAWGWGSVSWDSWEEAIDGHVRGLARGYGYTISVEAAQKYCPPNWEHWYSSTLAQMNSI